VVYYTQNHRVVHGGGGIQPDIEIGEAEFDRFVQALLSQGLLFQFSIDYLNAFPELKESGDVQAGDGILAEFRSFLKDQKFDFELEGEDELKDFLEIAGKNEYDADIQDLVNVAIQKLNAEKALKFAANRETILHLLGEEFAEKIEGPTARIKISLKNDNQVSQALTVLNNLPQYQEILAINE
jgi:carboxyl-terminal processing protease